MKDNITLLESMRTEFENEFKIHWDKFIWECDQEISQARQLNIGDHTRPF